MKAEAGIDSVREARGCDRSCGSGTTSRQRARQQFNDACQIEGELDMGTKKRRLGPAAVIAVFAHDFEAIAERQRPAATRAADDSQAQHNPSDERAVAPGRHAERLSLERGAVGA